MSAHQIFISYRRELKNAKPSDGAAVAKLLKIALSDKKYDVFLDVKDNTDAGEWKQGIEEALETVRDFIVVVSPDSLNRCVEEDDVVRWEIETAFARYDKLGVEQFHIIPVFWRTKKFKGTDPSSFGASLPDTVKRLFKLNGLVFNGELSGLDSLYEAVQSMLLSKPSRREISPSVFKLQYTSHRPDQNKETGRLHLQARYSERLDAKLLNDAYEMLGKREGLTALDVGCADGFVTERRLCPENGFSKVVGIDYNQTVIDKAKRYNANVKGSIYSYACLNVEAEDFGEQLRSVLSENGMEKVDVIYSAFTLHHLKNPVSVLQTLNDFLTDDGVVIIRGVDDRSQLFFVYDPDSGEPDVQKSELVDDVTKISLKTEGMSNRLHGRQFYAWLRRAGYFYIKSEYTIEDTVEIESEDREKLFDYYFSFRSDYTLRAKMKDPANAAKEALHAEMSSKLTEIKDIFINDDNAYYMVVAFGMIAKHFA